MLQNVACHQHRCYLGKQGTPISPIHSLITDRTERGNESGTRLSHPYNETTYKWFSWDVASLLEAKTPGSVFSVASKIQARKPYIYLRKCWKIKVKNAAFLKVKCSLYSCLLTVWFPYKSTVLKLTFVNYIISPENFDLQLSSESRLHNLPPYQGTATDRVGTRERGREGREREPSLIMQLAGCGMHS